MDLLFDQKQEKEETLKIPEISHIAKACAVIASSFLIVTVLIMKANASGDDSGIKPLDQLSQTQQIAQPQGQVAGVANGPVGPQKPLVSISPVESITQTPTLTPSPTPTPTSTPSSSSNPTSTSTPTPTPSETPTPTMTPSPTPSITVTPTVTP